MFTFPHVLHATAKLSRLKNVQRFPLSISAQVRTHTTRQHCQNAKTLGIRGEFNYVQHRGAACTETCSAIAVSSNTFDITTPSPETLGRVKSSMTVPKGRATPSSHPCESPPCGVWTRNLRGRLVLHREILRETGPLGRKQRL